MLINNNKKVNIEELSKCYNICLQFNCNEGASRFNSLRSRALGRAYCDFKYECSELIEELKESGIDTKCIDALKDIIG